jgi:hypothetical protein
LWENSRKKEDLPKIYIDLLILANSPTQTYKFKQDSILASFKITKQEYDKLLLELMKSEEDWNEFTDEATIYLDTLKLQARRGKFTPK